MAAISARSAVSRAISASVSGTARYGTLSGFFAAPITAATALAPWAGTALAEVVGSYAAAFSLLAGVVLVAAALAWWAASERPAP